MKRMKWAGIMVVAVGFFVPFLRKPPLEIPPTLRIKDSKCLDVYQKFYQKDEVEFRVVFGYKDSRPARFVGDRYERAHLVERLKDLNFIRDPDDDDLFATQIRGPDQHLKTVKLRLLQSSVGPDDDDNRRNPFQRYRSSEAEKVFLEGLVRADAVFYNGHSRDGGGPDFEPPLCVERNQHVNYLWYKKNQPGIKKMRGALKCGSQSSPLIGLFSCSSEGHFAAVVLKHTQSALIATSSLLYYSDALDGLVDTIDGLLKLKCQEDFHPLGTRFIGFFSKQ